MITPTIAGTNQATCCEDDQCTCTNGNGATGAACAAGHGNAQCGSCDGIPNDRCRNLGCASPDSQQ